MKEISSTTNPLVKYIVELKSKSSVRKSSQTCIIEGQKEIEIALESGINITTILVEKSWYEAHKALDIFQKTERIILTTNSVMDKIAMRNNKNSVIAIAQTIPLNLDTIQLPPNPMVLILENIEKPGNLGALFRTCDASQVEVILCTEMQTDLYNPNVIRNSLGCVFSQKIVFCTNEEAKDFCMKNEITIYATYLHTETFYYQNNFKLPTAIVFGTESTGISNYWQEEADMHIKIPMLGKIDSMNVSNSASILLYEVVRQRLS